MLIAHLFRYLFMVPFFKKRYYAFYIKIFRPLRFFNNKTTIRTYGQNLKIKLHLHEWIQQQIFFFGTFDPRGINFLKKNLNPGDVFIDIGANIGCYSLIASSLTGDNGKIIAFEAVTNVYDQLIYNISINKISNIRAEKLAIFEKRDILKFFLSSDENLGMSSIFRHDTESGKTEDVEAVSLDEYLADYPLERVNLIKIDIEGAEMHALKGMKNTIEKHFPVLMIEINNDVLPDKSLVQNEIMGFLISHGYSPYVSDLKGDLHPLNDTVHSGNYHNYVFKISR
jgi:FkbM family methyltransferase